jgi:hypothetical protein
MTKQDAERRLELSPAQIAGSALAAMSGAAVISWAGTAGTLIGAAAGSVIATVGAATYTWSLRRTRDAVKRTAAQVRTTALVTSALPRRVSAGPMRATEIEQGDHDDLDDRDDAQDLAVARRGPLAYPWAKVTVASIAVMLLGLAGVTAVEAVTGKPLASLLGSDNSTGTTVGHVVGADNGTTHQHRTPTKQTPASPTPTPSDAPSAQPQQPLPSTTPAPTPAPSTPPGTGSDTGPDTGPDTPVPPVDGQAPAPGDTQP